MTVPPGRKKGDALEDAVRAIEDAILRTAPGYAESTSKIQGKRIVSVGGVRHEIDVFVTASLATGYESTFIFECKNWDAKVGKNEVIVFSEKIDAVGAQRGFLVATAFTRDARAQAAKDSRLELLVASRIEPVARLRFPQLQLINLKAASANVRLGGFVNGAFPSEVPISLAGKTIVLNGVQQPAEEYMAKLVASIRDKSVGLSVSNSSEGDHNVAFSDVVTFQEGEAFLEAVPLRSIAVSGVADVSLAYGSVLSVFDVQSRGRLLQVEAESHGLSMQATLVEINSSGEIGGQS